MEIPLITILSPSRWSGGWTEEEVNDISREGIQEVSVSDPMCDYEQLFALDCFVLAEGQGEGRFLISPLRFICCQSNP